MARVSGVPNMAVWTGRGVRYLPLTSGSSVRCVFRSDSLYRDHLSLLGWLGPMATTPPDTAVIEVRINLLPHRQGQARRGGQAVHREYVARLYR
jgi:hypothetical protein